MNQLTVWFVALCLASTITASAQEPLHAVRDRLAAQLESKPAPNQLLLRFVEGADRDDMVLTLRRAGPQWATSFAEVPGWQQSTMQEWRGFYLANEVGGCWRPNLRFGADTSALRLEGQQLQGKLQIAYRLDQTTLQRQPPGVRLQWWDKFIPGGYSLPRTQNYQIDAEVHADACLLDLVLEGGLYWDPSFAPGGKKGGITRRPIYLRLQVPSTRFSLATARTPTWNGGFHEADATGLKFADGNLTGKLVVFIHQDGWMPWSGGKHTQHEPLPISFELDAQLQNNRLRGKYSASLGGPLKGAAYRESEKTIVIPDTKFAGSIGGRGGKLVVGRYSATGDLGEQVGALNGMWLDQPLPLRQQLATAGTDANSLFHQVRALHLALQHYPLSFEDAWRQTDMPAPTEAGAPTLAALPAPDTKLPVAKPETVGDSPSLGAVALLVEDKANLLPAQHTGWAFLSQWQILGSFEQREGLENNTGLLPDLIVLPEASYSQPVDRLGALKADEKTIKWQPVSCTSPRLGVPWESTGLYVRFSGRLWYGAATLRSAQARTVWLSVEANDFAKLWVNNQLVWADAEKTWRYRQQGRVFVPVALQAGDNQLLARVHADRRISWLRLALSTTEPTTPAVPAQAPSYANPYIFPEAQPPLAWDITKGINVAWRNPALGGKQRPLVLGDALIVATDAGTLECLDLATGKQRWSAAVGTNECAEPVTAGQRVYAHASAKAACFDRNGKQLWTSPTGLGRARVYLGANRLVLEGDAAAQKQQSPVTTVLILDAATGQEQKRLTVPGRSEKAGELFSQNDGTWLLTATGALVDVLAGTELPGPDIETQQADKGAYRPQFNAGPYVLSRNADMLFLTSQARHQAARVWVQDGKLASAQAWESNYGNSGFGNAPAPAIANDQYLFTTHSVLAHTPHCPDPRAEINVQDAQTGRWLGRLKPAMDDLYSYGALNLKPPVIAGSYLFLLGGRADNKRNQITIATADQHLQLIANNDVDPGTGCAPVFAHNRLILRSPSALTCIAVTTPEGQQYQAQVLARTLLKVLGPLPQSAKPRVIIGLENVSARGDLPVGRLIPERTTEFWLGAGPFPAADLAGLGLPALDRLKLTPVDRDHAYNQPPMYLRTAELQGTGDLTPHFKTDLDPSAHAGPQGSGLFYTVFDNARDRVVLPALGTSGLRQWLGSQELKPDEPLALRPGLYPYLLQVDPEHFKTSTTQEPPTIKVPEALAAGVLQDSGWPKTWQVLGPLPADAPALEPAQLLGVPTQIGLGALQCPLFPFPVENQTVNLNALSETTPGQKPDLANAPKKLTTTSPMSAYLFSTVDCPADGYLYISAGADWYMKWFVDGQPLSPALREGVTGKVEAHRFTARVTKGRHVVAVLVKPGQDGWSLTSQGAFSEKSPEQLGEYMIPAPAPKQILDPRLNPSFREIPHPATLEKLWRERVSRNKTRLEALARDLPNTEEARQAAAALQRLQ